MKDQDGRVIQYLDGWAYGVAPTGKTVWLGAEDYVKELLLNPRKQSNNPTIAQIISLERTLMKQEEKVDKKVQRNAEVERDKRHKLAEKLGVAKQRQPRKNKKRG